MNMHAAIFTGDRNATEEKWGSTLVRAISSYAVLDTRIVIFHGDAKGIDRLADMHGSNFDNIALVPMPARWLIAGRSAGPQRNTAMLSMLMTLRTHGYVIAVEAFHDDFDNSRGTADMVNQARRKGITTRLWTSDGECLTLWKEVAT